MPTRLRLQANIDAAAHPAEDLPDPIRKLLPAELVPARDPIPPPTQLQGADLPIGRLQRDSHDSKGPRRACQGEPLGSAWRAAATRRKTRRPGALIHERRGRRLQQPPPAPGAAQGRRAAVAARPPEPPWASNWTCPAARP